MGLSEKDFGPDPLAEFGRWIEHAKAKAGQPNPNAMALCTVGADGWPQGRIVLLKGWDAQGLVFYTNSRSRKGGELAANPRAAALLHWDAFGRQVRLEGRIVKSPADERMPPMPLMSSRLAFLNEYSPRIGVSDGSSGSHGPKTPVVSTRPRGMALVTPAWKRAPSANPNPRMMRS